MLKDFYLAKRFYDQAAIYDSNAKTPSALAVAMLKVVRPKVCCFRKSNFYLPLLDAYIADRFIR